MCNQQAFWLLLILNLACLQVTALDNGLGLTPQMGWNSWNHFACNLNETVIKQTADLLISTGLAAKGYQYVNLDDCWQEARNKTTSEIIADHERFPSGIANLADYIHGKGLKFGLYSDAGLKTCGGRPGSLGYEEIDAQTYSKWNVDYLKYDNCNDDGYDIKERYTVMRNALNHTGRKIFFSMCEWGVEKPWQWAADIGNSWRSTGDISDHWNSFTSILDQNADLYKYSKKGAWNDPDMLEVGNGGMTNSEYQAHFALWALLKAPLLIGCDLGKMSNDTLTILGNEEIIAINQDSLGKQGRRIKQVKNVMHYYDIWAGELSDGFAVILFNRFPNSVQIEFTLKEVGVKGNSAKIRDLVNHKELGNAYKSYTMNVAMHSVQVLKLTEVAQLDKFEQQFLKK